MCSDLFGYPNSEGPEPVLAISMTSLGSIRNDLCTLRFLLYLRTGPIICTVLISGGS